jgi:integrase
MSDLIHAHCAWLRAGGRSSRTVEAREYWLRRADTELAFGVIDAVQGELTAWIGQDGWSLATREKVFYHLHEFYLWGINPRHAINPDEPVFSDNPMVGMIRPKAPKGEPNPVTDEELEIVLGRAREPYRTAAILAYGAGLRCSELSVIRREEINEERVRVKWGKGGRSASVPTTEIVWSHVRDFPRGCLIANAGGVSDGRRMSARASIYFSRTLKLPGVCLHRLRHKYAEDLKRGGADISAVSRLLRHKHLSSTQVYAGASEAECRLAVQALRPSTPNPQLRNRQP